MNLSDYKNKKVAVWGYGVEGKASEAFLMSFGIKPVIITEDDEDEITDMDLVVKSPGISLYKPIIKEAKAKGVKFTSGTELFLEYAAQLDKKPILIAVTGTKGKSTTAALLAHILKGLRKRVFLGGNFGEPLLCAAADLAQYDFVVAEVSSYQAADLERGFDVAILTNLYPEHLNWHGSHERYFKDKCNVVFKSSVKVVNKDDIKTNEIFAGERVVFFNDEKLCEAGDLPLKGEHNLSNANAVLTCLKELKFNVANAKKHLATFEPLPHRLQEVGEKEGLTFIDDSISTTPETAIAALKVFAGREVTLLVGGFERQQNYAELCKYIKEHKVRAVTLPSTGARIYKEVTALGARAAAAENMQEAVEIAKEITPRKGVVLLSPAAPSYDFYKNFEERGKVFKSCI